MAANEEIRVLTLNCWGIPYLTKECDFRLACIGDELAKGRHDIVALQEIWTEEQYKQIKTKVADVLPHSHYFESGVIGTGICVFSKYPILDAFLHPFSTNGKFYAVLHGDWFAGKGIGCCIINHPKGKLYFFNQHLHADYPSNAYKELRSLQAYESAQFITKLTRPGDSIILCGDFNHEETEIGVKVIKMLPGLEDSWRTAAKKTPAPCNTLSGKNPYANKNEQEKRIDFIMHSRNMTCVENVLDYEEIPGTHSHFSDHKGVNATFKFNDGSTEARQQSKNYPTTTRLAILKELQDTIAFGWKSAEEYKWSFIIPVWILLLTFIFMPVFSEGGLYFLLPILSRLSGQIVFFIQIISVAISVSYFWMLVILKKMEQRAYKNAVLEIQFKMDNERNEGLLSSLR